MKTTKGTELRIIQLKGKDYLEVAQRLIWFREEHNDWAIETEFLQLTDKYAIAKAVIKDQNGRVISMSHKREDVQHFQDYGEKAETGAIGRALALCGYGTQFAADLDEQAETGAQFKDSTLLGDYRPTFGKYQGKSLSNFEPKELLDYVKYIENKSKEDRKAIVPQVAEFIRAVQGYAQECRHEA